MVLVHLGAEALREGKTVIQYTLELQDTIIASRYDSCLTGYPLSDLHNFKEEIYKEIKDMDGSLIIKEYPTKSASPNVLRSHLEKLKKRNQKIDMILVDYADLLKPVGNYKEKRMELESIYEGLRGLAQEFKCPIWTASQTNRSGLNAEVNTMDSISEAFSKCFISDFIFTVSRTMADKQNNGGRIFVAKNRFGPDGIIFPIEMETANVHIDVKSALTGDQNPITQTITATQQSEILRENYKKFRKDIRKK